MTKFVIGDENYSVERDCSTCGSKTSGNNEECDVCKDDSYWTEVNTSYDQNQPIGDTPSDYPAAGAEPIDAVNGTGFLDVGIAGAAPKIGEKLNKDGTGVARATRGVNPNSAKYKVLKFIYVSSSDCQICKEFDGKSFAVDSPNRPVIPRLESQGKKGGRPYTHPNCKCKWQNVFNESVTDDDYKRAAKWYGNGFEELSTLEKKMQIINMLKDSLGMEAVRKYSGEAKIQGILDGVVDNTYGKDDTNDTKLDTLFEQIAEIIIKQKKKSLGMESTTIGHKNHNIDKYLEIAEDDYEDGTNQDNDRYENTNYGGEGGKGSGKHGHKQWMLGAEVGDECPNCMMITEVKDGVCIVCHG